MSFRVGRAVAEAVGRSGGTEASRVAGDLADCRNGRQGNLRSHQKGHMNVYYIEKREKEERIAKSVFPRIKNIKTHKLECQRNAMLHSCITRARVYVHICIWRYVHRLCCGVLFLITCTEALLKVRGSRLVEGCRGRSPALLLWRPGVSGTRLRVQA